MSGWISSENGDVKLIHHSTASIIQIVVTDEHGTSELWLDYYQFEQLKKAIKHTEPEHYEQSKPSK